MITSVNGKEAPWTADIQAKWDATAEGRPEGVVTWANYFTPRPYQDEYCRGSTEEGFTYVLRPPNTIHDRVMSVVISRAERVVGQHYGKPAR